MTKFSTLCEERDRPTSSGKAGVKPYTTSKGALPCASAIVLFKVNSD